MRFYSVLFWFALFVRPFVPFGCLFVRLLGLSVGVALFALYGLILSACIRLYGCYAVIALYGLILALFGLFGCLLLSIVGCIVSFKAIYLPCVAFSFRLGTFIHPLLFRAVVGQNKNILLLLSGCMRARVIIIY